MKIEEGHYIIKALDDFNGWEIIGSKIHKPNVNLVYLRRIIKNTDMEMRTVYCESKLFTQYVKNTIIKLNNLLKNC